MEDSTSCEGVGRAGVGHAFTWVVGSCKAPQTQTVMKETPCDTLQVCQKGSPVSKFWDKWTIIPHPERRCCSDVAMPMERVEKEG